MKKLPTIKEIARRLNVSASTVSRALHDHPSIGLRTKTRIKELAKELKYEPIQTAIFFKQGRTHTLGVILPYLSETFFALAVSGIEDAAFLNNYSVMVAQSHDSLEKEKQIALSFIKHRVDGVLVSVSKETKKTDHLKELEEYNIPVVYFDRAPDLIDIHKVTCNLYKSSMQLIDFLYKNSHRKIALLRGPQFLTASSERMKGFMDGLSKKRLKADPNFIADTDLTKESTFKAMEILLSQKQKPTAVIAFNDLVALDAIQYIKQNTKLQLNKDISFVSYANVPFCKYLDDKPVASVEQFPYEQGKAATDILMRVLKNENTEPIQSIIDTQIILH